MLWWATRNNQFRYCGEYLDQETDSYYLRARYYDPALGRFITEDPARDGIHWYAYTLNTPILNCDPSGMWIETILDVAGIAWSFADFIANPSLVNAAFLVWDVASIVLPLAPGSYVAKGGKYIIKSGSKADDVVDSLKALNAADRAKSIKDGEVVMAYKDLKK